MSAATCVPIGLAVAHAWRTTAGGTNVIANNTIYSFATYTSNSNATSYGIYFDYALVLEKE